MKIRESIVDTEVCKLKMSITLISDRRHLGSAILISGKKVSSRLKFKLRNVAEKKLSCIK